jgi:hypothetical protein
MRVPLTGVANAQNVTIHLAGVNGGSGTSDVAFGFLIADADASRAVNKMDQNVISAQVGQPVTSANFREDVRADGTINSNDVNEVKRHKNTSLP